MKGSGMLAVSLDYRVHFRVNFEFDLSMGIIWFVSVWRTWFVVESCLKFMVYEEVGFIGSFYLYF